MPASQEQKVDFLLKKIGYSASKTGIAEDESAIGLSTNTAKAPFEEGIPSPLIIPSTNILSDSSFIPTTPPGSDTAYVKVYPTSSALRMTRDSTVGTSTRTYIAYTTYNDTSSARLTNWIDTQFGSSYILKVFKNDPTVPANELQQAGAGGGTDGWFFDYSSGVLNFNGNALPSGISATNIYIVGYRYIGATGVQPPAGIGTFHDLVISNNLSVGGISTFTGAIDANGNLDVDGRSELDTVNISETLNVVGVTSISTLTSGRVVYAGTNGKLQDSNNLRFNGTNLFVSGINVTNPGSGVTSILGVDIVTRNLKATGVSTFVGNAQFDNAISVGSTTGIDGYYLKSTGIGVTWAAFPSSRTGLTTTATAGQTTFNFSYNIGFVDVFVNGVKLPASEFTANNGSTIVLDDAAFANDTLEFISLNTLPVTSGGGASNLTGLADVTITGTPVVGETLQHNGVKFVNDYHPHLTTTSTSQVSITNLPIASYRSAEYLIQVTEGTKYHVTKVLAIHDGTNVTFNEYGTLTTSTSLSTFALDVSSGNMRLLATPASTNSTAFKVKFTGIKV